MSEPEFWRNLSAKFASVFDPGNQLRARWKCPVDKPDETSWEIAGETSAEARNHFLTLARIAGAQLTPNSPDPLRAWLNRLKATRPRYDERWSEYGQRDGTTIRYESANVAEICQASANLCDELELYAELHEREMAMAKRSSERESKIC